MWVLHVSLSFIVTSKATDPGRPVVVPVEYGCLAARRMYLRFLLARRIQLFYAHMQIVLCLLYK